MPTTVSAILVIVFGVLPGVPGDKLYRMLVGYDWREDQWHKAVRLVGFSLFGLALYVVVAVPFDLPSPAYLNPDSLVAAMAEPALQVRFFGALIGHFLASTVSGLGAALLVRLVGRTTKLAVFAGAWDSFVYSCLPGRWAVVALKNGDSFAGMVDSADTSVGPGERDIVLEEPAEYQEEVADYVAMNYEYLFIPGEAVASIAAVHDPELDSRKTELGTRIFRKGSTDGEQEQR